MGGRYDVHWDAAVSAVIPFLLMDKYGLKMILTMSTLPKVIAWLTLGFGNEYWMLLVGRFLSGVGCTLCYCTVPLYICEIIDKDLRGRMGTFFSICFSCGVSFSNIIGVYFDRSTTSCVLMMVPVAFFLGSNWIPTTPLFLIRKNKDFEAKKVLMTLGEDNVDERLREMKESLDKDKTSTRIMETLRLPAAQKSLIHTSAILLCDNAYLPLMAYESYVFEESGVNVDLFIILSSVIPLTAVCLFLGIVRYTGKRKLVLNAVSLLLISELVIALYYTMEFLEVDTSSYRWVPSVFTVSYITGSGCNYAMLTCYLGEIFPYSAKSTAILYCTVLFGLMSAFITKFHEV